MKNYIFKLQEEVLTRDVVIYWQPKQCNTDSLAARQPWYLAQPVGRNTLIKGKLKEIFPLAGLDMEAKSNHSLRATSISRLYTADVPEKLILYMALK